MGSTSGYQCANCEYKFSATKDFDCGMVGTVVTPVVCPEHGIQSADTGTKAWDRDTDVGSQPTFPCHKCGTESPRWDRQSCPKCGGKVEQTGLELLWD